MSIFSDVSGIHQDTMMLRAHNAKESTQALILDELVTLNATMQAVKQVGEDLLTELKAFHLCMCPPEPPVTGIGVKIEPPTPH